MDDTVNTADFPEVVVEVEEAVPASEASVQPEAPAEAPQAPDTLSVGG